ncbi:MAG TPA: SH3 domain-containing protein [Ktedonobacteraceae bacterium]|nr:SH3 domain-containing protein [Ktedonobacteraceae bacterium]
MNRPQTGPERKCRVAKDYQAEFPDPIAVEAGEAFAVSERNSAWENNPAWIWVWCTDQRGKSGWVPKNIIQMDADGQTGTAPAAYNAIELTVTAGQGLTIEHEESGWFWCCDQQGKRGWVPISHVMA